jgi:hypothetical protein
VLCVTCCTCEQHLVVLHYRLGQLPQMVERYKEMLGYVTQVTRNECTDRYIFIYHSIQCGT